MHHLVATRAGAALLTAASLQAAATAGGPYYFLEHSEPIAAITGIDLSPDGTRVVVQHTSGYFQEGLLILDVATWEVLSSCTDIPSTPWVFRFTADGEHLWCTRYYGGHVSRIDPETCQIVESYDVGSWPVDMIFDTSRRYLLVGENHPGGDSGAIGSIQVIDTWTGQHLGGISLHGQPGQSAMADGDRYYYVISANMASDTERLYKIDTADWSLAGVLNLPDTGGNVGVSVSPDFRSVYVPRRLSNSILEIDTESLTIEREIFIDDPSHISVSPHGGHAIVLHDELPMVSVLDLETEAVQPIFLESSSASWKREIVWDRDGTRAFVNHSDGILVLRSERAADITAGRGPVDVTDLTILLTSWSW